MNNQTPYPTGTVRALLHTDHVSLKTREVLTNRLDQEPIKLRFFDQQAAGTLQRVIDLLIPQPADQQHIDLIGPIDSRLFVNEGDGWRYNNLPNDQTAYQLAIQGFHQSAQALFGLPFDQLNTAQKIEIIGQVQRGKAPGEVWQSLPSDRFFVDLLAEVAAIYYSHPLVQERIGYVGMADKPAWVRIGLDTLEDREPLPLPNQ